MTTRVHQTRAPATAGSARTTLGATRGFAARAAEAPDRAAGGDAFGEHDFARIAIAPPTGGSSAAPLQLQKKGGRVGRKKLMKYLYKKDPPPRAQAQPQPQAQLAPVVLPALAEGEDALPSSMQPDSDKRGKKGRKKEWRERRARKQQGRSAGPLDTLAVSRTKVPLQHDEVTAMAPSGRVDPHRIRTIQSTATNRFTADDSGHSSSVMDTVRDLTAYKRSLRTDDPEDEPDVPPIDIIRQEDPDTGEQSAYTLDNRRLYAYRRANLPINYRLSEGAGAEDDFQRKFSTKDKGMSMRIVPSASERVPYTPEDLHGEEDGWED